MFAAQKQPVTNSSQHVQLLNNSGISSKFYPNSVYSQFQSYFASSLFYEILIKSFAKLSIHDDDVIINNEQVSIYIPSESSEFCPNPVSSHVCPDPVSNPDTNSSQHILGKSKDDYKSNPTTRFEVEHVIRANSEEIRIKGTIYYRQPVDQPLPDGNEHASQFPTGQYLLVRQTDGERVDHCSVLNVRENAKVEYFDPLGDPPPKWIINPCYYLKCVQNPCHNTCALHCLCVLKFMCQGLTLQEIIKQYCDLPQDLNTKYYDDYVIDFYIRKIRYKLEDCFRSIQSKFMDFEEYCRNIPKYGMQQNNFRSWNLLLRAILKPKPRLRNDLRRHSRKLSAGVPY